jgi:HEAT repeat protein
MTEENAKQLKLLESGSIEDLWEAAKAISAEATELQTQLLRLLAEGERSDVRAAAAYALGMGRFGFGRQALEESLEDVEEHSTVRGYAAEALAYLQSSDSLPVLCRHISDPDVAVRYWVIFALGAIGGRDVIPLLRSAAEQAGDARYNGVSLEAEAMNAIEQIEAR